MISSVSLCVDDNVDKECIYTLHLEYLEECKSSPPNLTVSVVDCWQEDRTKTQDKVNTGWQIEKEETSSRRSVPAFAWRENHSGKTTLRTPDRDSKLDLPVIGSLVQHEGDALDHVATEADNLPAHSHVAHLSHIELVFLAANTASLLQPMEPFYKPLGTGDGNIRPPRPMATACSKLSGHWLGGGGQCVGDAFNFGKLMEAGLSWRVDGLLGVGGRRRPCPRRVTKTG
uniref:Uncharacterized protein n=1 Tax=Timema genevievae TaxID=629358 RepID=A0A7R9PRX4_TIMGE|nr:unnamed protein product [Timema genevievae]